MLARKSSDRLSVLVRGCGMRNVSSARKRTDFYPRKGFSKLGNHKRERRLTLVAEREEDWVGEPFYPCDFDSELLRICCFVEECGRILNEHLLEFRRHLSPRAGPERDGFDELLRGTGSIPRGDALNHGSDPLIRLIDQRG